MKYSRGQARTTVTLDEKTLSNLDLLAKLNRGISHAIQQACQPIETYYQPEGFKYDQERARWFEDIVAYAKKLNICEKSSSQKKIRKSVVIPPESLRSLNKMSKEKQIKRDHLFMGAINIDAKGSLKVVKLEIELKKKFLKEVLRPMYEQFIGESGRYFDEAWERRDPYCSYSTYVGYDFDPGMSSLGASWALEKDIETFEQEIHEMEELI